MVLLRLSSLNTVPVLMEASSPSELSSVCVRRAIVLWAAFCRTGLRDGACGLELPVLLEVVGVMETSSLSELSGACMGRAVVFWAAFFWMALREGW